MSKRLIVVGNCCFRWIDTLPVVLLGSYIAEDSTYDPETEPYIPYINENNDNFYYVKEDYMADNPIPRKHSEDPLAGTLDGMSAFVGLKYNTDGSIDNVNYSASQIINLVADLLRESVFLDEETDNFWTAGTTTSYSIQSANSTVMNQTLEDGGGYTEEIETVSVMGVPTLGLRRTRNDSGTWGKGKLLLQK